MIFVKILKYDAPSMRAASIDDSGIYFILCLSKQIPNAEKVPGNITAKNISRVNALWCG